MKKIIEVSQLPENEKIYFRKDIFGYRIVHPIKDENGKVNYINLIFGGWRNLVTLLIILFILGAMLYGFKTVLDQTKERAEHPCDYCGLVNNGLNTKGSDMFQGINMTQFKEELNNR